MRFYFILFSLLFLNASFSQKKLRAYLDTKQFYSPEIGNYFETYIQFSAESVSYIGTDNGLIGKLGIDIIVSNEKDTLISDKYLLESPVMIDSIVEDFYDLRRYVLKPGDYNFSIQITDVLLKDDSSNQAKGIASSFPISVDDFSNKICFSGLEIAEYAFASKENNSFCKSGYHIIPRIISYYPKQLNRIPLYFEVYNTDKGNDSVYVIKQSLWDKSENNELEEHTIYSKIKTNAVIPTFKIVDISEIPTGKYLLKYELINRQQEIIAIQSYAFDRANDQNQLVDKSKIIIDPAFQKSISEDSVSYFLESLIPIADQKEVKNIIKSIKTENTDLQRKYLQAFWTETAPNNTYEAWIKYKHQVQFVEKIYANNFQEGFETDRGVVYLKYGSPTNIINRENSPSEYPYEIWQYNKIKRFSNKRFVFYNPDLVNRAYRLLHSDMIGELKNPQWRQILSKRNTSNGNVDDPNRFLQDHFGGNSDDLFRQY